MTPPLFEFAGDPNSILVRHKKFLKQLERQKNAEREENQELEAMRQNKTLAFRENAARQREKVKSLKQADIRQQNEENL